MFLCNTPLGIKFSIAGRADITIEIVDAMMTKRTHNFHTFLYDVVAESFWGEMAELTWTLHISKRGEKRGSAVGGL